MKNIWILVIVYMAFLMGCGEYNCEINYRKSEIISGVVKKKHIHEKDTRHGIRIEVLDKGEHNGFIMYKDDTLGLYKALQVGDSIAKDSGSLIFRIYHFDTLWVDMTTNKVIYDTIFTTYDAAKDCERLEGNR